MEFLIIKIDSEHLDVHEAEMDILDILTAPPTSVDVGANIGQAIEPLLGVKCDRDECVNNFIFLSKNKEGLVERIRQKIKITGPEHA